VVQATYTNVDGTSAVSAMYVNLLSPTPEESVAGSALQNARAARVLTVGGTRTIEDVQQQLDFAAQRLGPSHPASIAIKVAAAMPLARDFKVLTGDATKVKVMPAEPDKVEKELRRVFGDNPEKAADTLGHITYERVINTYTQCAVQAGKRKDAAEAQRTMVAVFKKRGVVASAINRAEIRLHELS
jgi:hypothetical protein